MHDGRLRMTTTVIYDFELANFVPTNRPKSVCDWSVIISFYTEILQPIGYRRISGRKGRYNARLNTRLHFVIAFVNTCNF